jgi:hypothetical protein
LFDSALAQFDALFDAVRNYEDDDVRCESGYSEYEASNGTRTCIFSALAYQPPAGVCFAGSKPSPWDVGGRSVCVYFPRDFIQTGGTCRTNYSKVTFLGKETCRWATLPLNKPVAYSLVRETGDKTILQR